MVPKDLSQFEVIPFVLLLDSTYVRRLLKRLIFYTKNQHNLPLSLFYKICTLYHAHKEFQLSLICYNYSFDMLIPLSIYHMLIPLYQNRSVVRSILTPPESLSPTESIHRRWNPSGFYRSGRKSIMGSYVNHFLHTELNLHPFLTLCAYL